MYLYLCVVEISGFPAIYHVFMPYPKLVKMPVCRPWGLVSVPSCAGCLFASIPCMRQHAPFILGLIWPCRLPLKQAIPSVLSQSSFFQTSLDWISSTSSGVKFCPCVFYCSSSLTQAPHPRPAPTPSRWTTSESRHHPPPPAA